MNTDPPMALIRPGDPWLSPAVVAKGVVPLVLTAIALAGCGTGAVPAASGPSATPVTRPPLASIEASPTPASAGSWGPLAVIPPQDGAETARTEGTMRITDTCAHLQSGGALELLFWPADRTMWSAESRSITFTNLDGSVVKVGDGDRVALGGGGGGEAEGGVTPEEWAEAMEWVAPPDASCLVDSWWGVSAVHR